MIRCAFASVERERGMPSHRLDLVGSLVFLLRLDPLPVRADLIDAVGPGVAEDMGMAPDHLLGDLAEDGGDVEFTRLFRHPGEEEDLKEEIAELLLELPAGVPRRAPRGPRRPLR